jgi:protein-disulfide isomerase
MKALETVLLIALVAVLAMRWRGDSSAPSARLVLGEAITLPDRPGSTTLSYGGTASKSERIDTFVVITDFQCPFCRRLHESLDLLAESERFVVELRHWPLVEIHPQAFAAAVAYECGSAQGRAKQMHDALFESDQSVLAEDWNALARAAGVADERRFADCLVAPDSRARVQADRDEAIRLGLEGTPTVTLGGRLVVGTPSVGALKSLLESRR